MGIFGWGCFFFIILFYGLFFSTVGVCTAARKGGAGFLILLGINNEEIKKQRYKDKKTRRNIQCKKQIS